MKGKNFNINGIEINNLWYGATTRGTAYSGEILMDGTMIGSFDNEGCGGYTSCTIFPGARKRFNECVKKYFISFGLDPENTPEYSLYYTFIEHLIDYTENGELNDFYKNVGMLV